MNRLLLLLLLAFTVPSMAQNYSANTDEKRIDALLDKLHARQASQDDRKELQEIAITLQNKGQDPQELQRQYKKSLSNIDKAIELFYALGDTLSEANNRKFKGFLLGRNGKMTEARKETQAAIQLYRLQNLNAEVAVSQFDLARMFEFESKPDSAIYYANLSRVFWKLKEVDLRVLIINNMLVSLFLKAGQPELAKPVQQESVVLVSKPQMQWQAIVDFYFTSMLLFKTFNDNGVAGDYRQLYNAKIDALRKQGIVAKSYYESDRE